MWLMPSYGRPEVLRHLLDAPGGWPGRVTVIVNEDDPRLAGYWQVIDALGSGLELSGSTLVRSPKAPWKLLIAPAGSRFANAAQFGYSSYPTEPFYGIIDDDYFPITPGWHEKMVAAAGATHIAIANNKVNFPSLYTCRVMGGELARAIGTIAPGKMRHNFSDDTWASFAEDFKLLRPLEDVIVEHRHHLFDQGVKKDATYDRGSKDFDEDRKLYGEWRRSDERRGQCASVAKLLGINISVTDLSKVKLAVCVPVQNHSVDVSFFLSFHKTSSVLGKKGVTHLLQVAAGGSHIGKSREHVLWCAMKAMPDLTHILFIDDDMGWDPDLIIRLLCADHEFAAVAGVKKKEPLAVCYNAFPDPQTLHPLTRFMKIRHVGFAFVLLKRSVIEKMTEAYPELEYDTEGHGREWALFYDLMWDRRPEKTLPERLSEDFAFCERWRRIGGEIWLDPYAELVHAGRKEYTGAAADLFRLPDGADTALVPKERLVQLEAAERLAHQLTPPANPIAFRSPADAA